MNKYFQIRASIDSKIIGRSESPLSVEVKNQIFSEQSRRYILDIDKYFEDGLNIYKTFPKNLHAKMYQKKKDPIDIMNVIPYYVSLKYAVSSKIKYILDELKVDSSEYHLEKFSIEGSDEKFFFLFIPILKNSDYVDYGKSVFYDGLNDKYAVFGSYEKYLSERKNGSFDVKTLFVSEILAGRDIISLQGAGPFYSERIIDAFENENVVGYEIIDRGDSKIDLNFSK